MASQISLASLHRFLKLSFRFALVPILPEQIAEGFFNNIVKATLLTSRQDLCLDYKGSTDADAKLLLDVRGVLVAHSTHGNQIVP